jgi:hypothetical protein
MPDTSGVFIEVLDDDGVVNGTVADSVDGAVELFVVPDVVGTGLATPQYLEVYDGSINVRSYTMSLPFTMQGTLVVRAGTGAHPIHPGTWRLRSVMLSVIVAPDGQPIKVDVNKSGVSLFSDQANRPQIAVGQTNGTVGAWDDLTFVGGVDTISVDVDQVGSLGSEGTTLVVSLLLERIA